MLLMVYFGGWWERGVDFWFYCSLDRKRRVKLISNLVNYNGGAIIQVSQNQTTITLKTDQVIGCKIT